MARFKSEEDVGPVVGTTSSMAAMGTSASRPMWARRASEEHRIGDDVLQSRLRIQKRLKSLPDLRLDGNRHNDIRINPKDQAFLHQLHEGLIRSRGGSNFDGTLVIPTKDLDCWGQDGSWHVHVQLPSAAHEPGFTTRPLKVIPKAKDAKAFLQSQGVAVINTKGCKGSDVTFGQDACSLSRLSSGWEVFCVMDGHGHDGHWPAYHSTRTLPYILQTNPGCIQMLKQGKVDGAMHHAFEKVQANLVHESLAKDIELQVAGCTALCVATHEQRNSVWVATAGDSRAVYLEEGVGVVAHTVDHKPGLPAERQRLEQSGCEVVTTEHEDGFVEERVNIWGTEYPGLCMSRSLGDLAVKDKGVIHEPDVVEWPIRPNSEGYVLAASDGVWEFMSLGQVADLVLGALRRGLSCQEACELLLKRARESWAEHEEDYCDDITVVIIPVRRTRPEPRRAEIGCCMGLWQMLGGLGKPKAS